MKFNIGDKATLKRVATGEDIEVIAQVSGDYNAMHFEDECGKEAGFESRIVHGLFLLGMISNVIGMQLPGDGAILMNQHFKYKRPVYIGDEIETTVEVEEIDEEKSRMKLDVMCVNQDDTVVLTGKTNVLIVSE